MTAEEAVPLLARMVAELQTDLAQANQRIHDLEQRVQVADDIRWWLDRHTPEQVDAMASALEAV